MLEIRVQRDLYAKLSHPLPPDLEELVKEYFCWINPQDLEDQHEFYSDGWCYVGVVEELAQFLNDAGHETRVAYPTLTEKDFDAEFLFDYRPLQEPMVEDVVRQRYGILCAPPGTGKCLGKDTPVLMWDGSVKPVQNVQVGDLLMGDDCTSRTIASTTAGQEEMFEVLEHDGTVAFTCNRSHILSLFVSGAEPRKRLGVADTNPIVDITVDEYLELPNYIKEKLKLYRAEADFARETQELPIPAYIFGTWLGDGTSRDTTITTMDHEVVAAWHDYTRQVGGIFEPANHQNSGKALTWRYRTLGRNHFRTFITKVLGLNKHIPSMYLRADKQTRLELLAGILDTDGYLKTNCYDLVVKSPTLADDVVRLIRSVGIAVTRRTKIVSFNGKMLSYERLTISGDVHQIPVRVERRKATKRKQIKNPLVRGFTVRSIGLGDYYGFEITGANRRFLLGDFTVTHNTVMLSALITRIGKRAVVLTEAEEPFEGAYKTLKAATTCKVGRVGGGYNEPADVTVCMVQTWNRRLSRDEVDPALLNVLENAKVWVTDEAHNCLCDSYTNMYDYATNVEYFIGTTATPFPSNGRETLLTARIGPIISEITYQQAIDNKLLVPFTCFIEKAPKREYLKGKKITDLSGYQRKMLWPKVYKDYIVKNKDRNSMYVDFARQMIEDGCTVAIIVSRVEHGAEVKKLMPEAVEVYGPTPKKERREAWKLLNERKIRCVITTLMDEATDVPSLDCVAIAAGGKQKKTLIQRLRNLRMFSGETADGYYTKERGYIYITEDAAPFVQSHSKTNIKNLRELAKQHEQNEIIRV